jgi:Glycosyltransferase
MQSFGNYIVTKEQACRGFSMNQPKKILIDLGKLKNRYSGLGEVSYNFGKTLSENLAMLKEQNFEVYLLVPKKCIGMFGNEFKYVSLNFFRRHFPFLNKNYNLWFAVHQDSGFMPGNKKSKYLLCINDLNFIYENNKSKIERRLKKVQKKVDRASYITTISRFTKSEVEKYLKVNGKPVEVIYCGVTDTQNTISEKPAEISADEKFFFHISTIMPKKNVMVLVDMMKLMRDKKLIIAGSWDSDYAKEILSRIRNEGIKNIVSLSKVSDEEKAWLFQNCEAFFFPSYQEGFGLPVIESMYCGKPVFSSAYTSLPEIGSDKAFYWQNFDPGYMKNIVEEKMKWICNNQGFAEELREYAKKFTWQKNITRYIALFKELLS